MTDSWTVDAAALKRREWAGVVVVGLTGPSGVGKSSVCHRLLSELGGDMYKHKNMYIYICVYTYR